jgi:Uncharacterized conserved protein related to dihydrodipicolinate reductase
MKIIFYGFGEINRIIAKKALERNYTIHGAIDIKPELINKDIGEIIGKEKLGVKVHKKLEEAIKEEKPDLVIHATSSFLNITYNQIIECVKNKLSVISTCEELVYPFIKYPSLAKELEKEIKKNNVRVLAIGVNPGFVMDSLPIFLSTVLNRIEHIYIKRSINASKRRQSFRNKIGIGLTKDEFEESVNMKRITGHVGLTESLGLISTALAMNYDEIYETKPIPILSKNKRVVGIKIYGKLLYKSKEVILLEFIASEKNRDTDTIKITGEPNITVSIRGGIPGDDATANIILNSIKPFLNLQEGLRTVLDLLKLHYS